MEDEGLATALVALVRRQAEEVAPPRALWVPFPLGRPFGAPGDPRFQHRVLSALLALYERSAGPVLEDFPEDAPPDGGTEDSWVCPVRFPKQQTGPRDALLAEVDTLAPWYRASLDRRGRTTMGGSGLGAVGAARFLSGWLEGLVSGSPVDGMTEVDLLRLASDDLKAYYMEAATARPGSDNGDAVISWFWSGTAAGKLIHALRRKCLESSDPAIRDAGDFMLVPESQTG